MLNKFITITIFQIKKIGLWVILEAGMQSIYFKMFGSQNPLETSQFEKISENGMKVIQLYSVQHNTLKYQFLHENIIQGSKYFNTFDMIY